jgi:hypothetical protein
LRVDSAATVSLSQYPNLVKGSLSIAVRLAHVGTASEAIIAPTESFFRPPPARG